MKTKDLIKLGKGDFVMHKHYGKCRIINHVFSPGIEFGPIEDYFGTIIMPETDHAKVLLSTQSGMPVTTPLLEHSVRMIKSFTK